MGQTGGSDRPDSHACRTRGEIMNRRKRMMEDLDQDIRDHIERETQDNIECGMPPEEARFAALRKFGNVARVKEDTWEVWSFGWLEQLWQDVRYGLRVLAKNPGFTAVAVLTLALGIASTTIVFSVFNAVVFGQLRYGHPERMVLVWAAEPRGGFTNPPEPVYLAWRDRATALESLAALADTSFD